MQKKSVLIDRRLRSLLLCSRACERPLGAPCPVQRARQIAAVDATFGNPKEGDEQKSVQKSAEITFEKVVVFVCHVSHDW